MSQLTLQLDANDDWRPAVPMQQSVAGAACADMDAVRAARRDTSICIGDLSALAGRTAHIVSEVQRLLSSDGSNKALPSFSLMRTRQLLGLTDGELAEALAATGLTSTAYLKLSVTDVQALAHASRLSNQRPSGVGGVVITVANCKGGVGKTTTTMTLAQGLSLRGYRVLAVDADPQGSLTKMFGLAPERIGDNLTIAPVLRDEISDVCTLAQKTYWPGLHLVPASPMLFGVEHEVAQLALNSGAGSALQRLRCAMAEARREYDLIILDTAPSLSLLSATAILAADGLLIPAPPTALDLRPWRSSGFS
jgi:chromosome partitioning protein